MRLILILLLLCSNVYAQEVIESFDNRNISVLNDELRHINKAINKLNTSTSAPHTLESQYAATDDTVLIGDSSKWRNQYIPDCDSGMLRYDTSTNTLSCGAYPTSGWTVIDSGDLTDIDATDTNTAAYTVSNTFEDGYKYKLLVFGYTEVADGYDGMVDFQWSNLNGGTQLSVQAGSNTFTNGSGGDIFADDGVGAAYLTKYSFDLDADIFYNTTSNVTFVTWTCSGDNYETTHVYSTVTGVGRYAGQLTGVTVNVSKPSGSPRLQGKYLLLRNNT